MTARQSVFRPRSRALALEPRILFDAAAAVAADPQTNPDSATHAGADAPGTAAGVAPPTVATDSVALPDQSFAALTPVDGAPPPTLLVIDTRIHDAATLLAGVPDDVTVVRVTPRDSGLALITQALAQAGQVRSLQILSHGNAGSIVLGADTLDATALSERASSLIASWSKNLTDNADILLLGCDVAASDRGMALLGRLAALTGADVAASADDTGSLGRGGDWELEVSTGPIDTPLAIGSAARDAYGALLAAPAVSTTAISLTVIEPSPLNASGASSATLSGWTISDDGLNSPNVTVDVTVSVAVARRTPFDAS